MEITLHAMEDVADFLVLDAFFRSTDGARDKWREALKDLAFQAMR